MKPVSVRSDQWPAIAVAAALMLTVCVPLIAELKDPRLVLIGILATGVIVATTGLLGRWYGLSAAVVLAIVSALSANSPMQRGPVIAIAVAVPLLTFVAVDSVTRRWPLLSFIPPIAVLALLLLVGTTDASTQVLLTLVVTALICVQLAYLAGARGSLSASRRGWLVTVAGVALAALVSGVIVQLTQPYLGEGVHAGLAPVVPDDRNDPVQDIGSPLQWATIWQLGLGDPDSVLLSLLPPVSSMRPVWVSLAEYRNGNWYAPKDYVPLDGKVPDDPAASPAQAVPAGMNIEVGLALPGPWIPVPQRVARVHGTDALGGDLPLRVNVATGTVGSSTRPGGHTFYAAFAIPVASGAQLRNAKPGLINGDDVAVALPGGLPPQMAQLARVVEDRAGPRVFDRLVLLASTLRSYGAATTADLGPGNSVGRSLESLDRVLVDERGFQEQYAAIWALIARSWGVPTSLSVGFLPPRGKTAIAVHTMDASVWADARLAGIGWVAFQPSPQDLAKLRPVFIRPWNPERPIPTPQPTPEPTPEPAPSPEPTPDAAQSYLAVMVGTISGFALVVVALGVWLVLVRILRSRRRRSCQRGDSRQQVIGAWRWALTLLAEAHMPLPDARAPGALQVDDLPDAEARYVEELATFVVPALYGVEDVDEAAARSAWQIARSMEEAIAVGSIRMRIRRAVRPVDRPWTRRQSRSRGSHPDAATASLESVHQRR